MIFRKGGMIVNGQLRPELSKKNQYWIGRHRYYELKHFCLQYPIWKQLRAILDGPGPYPSFYNTPVKISDISDPTLRAAEIRLYYSERMTMVEEAAKQADAFLSGYIIYGVTMGVSYDIMNAKFHLPCTKDTYYVLYRKFFWILDKLRM